MRVSPKTRWVRLSVRFFSGFGLQHESDLFEGCLIQSDYTVAGFSKGAIEAFEYVLGCKSRVDLLQLISPAFFQQKPERFKKLQLRAFMNDSTAYLKQFLQNCAYPSDHDLTPYRGGADTQTLEFLLHYRWEREKIEALLLRGIRIEVYLGGQDRIIDVNAAKEWFAKYASVYYFTHCGHIIEGEAYGSC